MIALKDSLGTEFVERIRTIFSENGRLSKAKNFEFRPQQQEMAMAVARALEEERHLVVEAGTGVGKSLAYLAPAILFALEQHKKAIVSTHTINLQEQLLYKDIPILKKILPVEFDAALMKGRQNYLCPRRLERALQQQNELFTGLEQNELTKLAEWSRTTREVICRSSLIRRFGSKFAANRISVREKAADSNRTVSTSKPASGFSRRM
jgi:ATP-dependent DNA helicase DinG